MYHAEAAFSKKANDRITTAEKSGNWLLSTDVSADIIRVLQESTAELKSAREATTKLSPSSSSSSSGTAKVAAWVAILGVLDTKLSQVGHG